MQATCYRYIAFFLWVYCLLYRIRVLVARTIFVVPFCRRFLSFVFISARKRARKFDVRKPQRAAPFSTEERRRLKPPLHTSLNQPWRQLPPTRQLSMKMRRTCRNYAISWEVMTGPPLGRRLKWISAFIIWKVCIQNTDSMIESYLTAWQQQCTHPQIHEYYRWKARQLLGRAQEGNQMAQGDSQVQNSPGSHCCVQGALQLSVHAPINQEREGWPCCK